MPCRSKYEIKCILDEYQKGTSKAELYNKYGVHYETINKWLKRYNIPDNYTGRFSQRYEIFEELRYAKIYIKNNGSYVECLIDIEDVEKCKFFGIWSLTKAGYVVNCKTGVYLHRYVMDAPNDIEVDHIYHNNLDNRKSQLRLATSRQQKFNEKLRSDNKSGHRGIYWDTERNKWHVNIKNGDTRITKRFDDYNEACNFCDMIFEEWHGEFLYKEKEVS